MTYRHEEIKPYNEEEKKSKQVEKMFNNIAPRYDLLNHLLSFNIDYSWRKKAINALRPFSPQTILDVATGTGDFAILTEKLLKPKLIIGCDISDGMMEVARKKCKKNGIEHIRFEHEDCTALTYSTSTFDAATVTFGIRNFENLRKGIKELHRILKKEGHLVVLEFSSPKGFPMKQAFSIYAGYILPTIGKLISGDAQAYSYLPQSIATFPQGEEMKQIFIEEGFSEVEFHRLTGGICTLYIATK